jgi:hypothetical protein
MGLRPHVAGKGCGQTRLLLVASTVGALCDVFGVPPHSIRWDNELDQTQFTVGYLDRFLGVLEVPFSKFEWGVIVQHRILYFKYKGIIIWDKRGTTRKERVDDVFGSLGALGWCFPRHTGVVTDDGRPS